MPPDVPKVKGVPTDLRAPHFDPGCGESQLPGIAFLPQLLLDHGQALADALLLLVSWKLLKCFYALFQFFIR
jgi:hypothetical protein